MDHDRAALGEADAVAVTDAGARAGGSGVTGPDSGDVRGLPRPAFELASSVTDAGFHRRIQTLLRSAPLQRLAEITAWQGWKERSYDPRVLGVAALDAVIARMGFTTELTYDDVVAVVAELARIAEPDAPATEWADIATYVIDGLLNARDESSTQFVKTYSDYRDGHITRELRFALLVERAHADGRIVLHATTDAINAFRGGLDLRVEDAQMAADYVLRAQLERGDLPEAEITAERSAQLTMELAAQIRDLLDATRMDLDSVDWTAEVLPRVERARQHVAERTAAEEALITHLAAGDESREEALRDTASRVTDLLELCLSRHRSLHAQLMSAPSIFYAEQQRQQLHARGRGLGRINVRDRLLVPVLGLPVVPAGDVAGAFADAVLGVRVERLPRLVDLVELLLAPRREAPEPAVENEVDLSDVDDEIDVIDAATLDAAQAVLARTNVEVVAASELLAEAHASGPAVAEVVRLAVLLAWAPDAVDLEDEMPLELCDPDVIAMLTGSTFDIGSYRGDELLVGAAHLFGGDSVIDDDEDEEDHLGEGDSDAAEKSADAEPTGRSEVPA